MSESVVVAVASAKGGVGKTTTSVNLGALVAATGTPVAAVEVGGGSLADFVDRDVDCDAEPTLDDVVDGDVTATDAAYPTPAGFDAVLRGTAPAERPAPDALVEAVSALRDAYGIVILDTPPGVTRQVLVALGLADAIVLVSIPRPSAVRDTGKTRELAERVDGRVVGVVFAMSGTATTPPVERLAELLGVELLGHVPEDAAVPLSQDAGVPVVSYRPESPAAKAYRGVAARLLAAIDAPSVVD